MDRGYIKLWRKTIDGGWLQNHKLWCFWCWCLLKATHKPIKQRVGFQEVSLEPGQFVFGRKVAAEELGVGEQVIRTCMANLKNSGNLTIKSTNKYSVVSIINWNNYQCDVDTTNQQTNMPLTSNQPTTNQQLTTNKNSKNKRTEEQNLKPTTQLFELPESVDASLWTDFLEMRKASRTANTPGAIKQLIIKLTKLKDCGNQPNEVIAQSLERGWKGLFEVKDNGGQPKPTLTERNLAAAAEARRRADGIFKPRSD